MMSKEHSLFYEKGIRFHIKFNKQVSLKEYAACILLINKSINDINRYCGVSNRLINNYATEILSFQSGSIIIDTLVKISKNKDKIIDFSKSIAGDIIKDLFVKLIVTLLLCNSNKNIHNSQNAIKININEINVNISMGKEYISDNGLYFVKAINEKTIEIRINN